MRTFGAVCAQGDVMFIRISALPKGVQEVAPEGGKVIVTHSETGHHHVMDAEKARLYRLPEEIYELFLVVGADATLDHLRPTDTHESILFAPGTYRVRRQREYVPDGFRRVED